MCHFGHNPAHATVITLSSQPVKGAQVEGDTARHVTTILKALRSPAVRKLVLFLHPRICCLMYLIMNIFQS